MMTIKEFDAVTSLRNTSFPARLGLLLWFVAVVFIGWKVLFEPGSHTVVGAYLLGGERWAEGIDLYTGPHGFIYMPLFAALFSPSVLLSEFTVDIVWRLLLVGTYFYALFSMTKLLVERNRQSEHFWQYFGLVSLIALPIAFSGLRNGQMNVLLSAIMVLLTVWLVEKHWLSAAMLLAFVISLKPTFAVFFLLAVALYRPLWWRVPPLVLGFLLIPFVVGGWEYGFQQYLNFIDMSKSAMELGMDEADWATFFNIAPQVFGVFIPGSIQLMFKLPLAVLTLLLCYRLIRTGDALSGAIYMLTFACCYHMLFNPRSVNTDYVIIGSVMALWFGAAVCLWKDRLLAWLIGMNGLTILLAYEMSKLITPNHHSWVNPLAAFVFTGFVLWQVKKERRFLI